MTFERNLKGSGTMKNNISSISVNNFNGIPIINYNAIVGINGTKIEVDGETYDGFYVSYNDHDVSIYGDVTTAVVIGQMQKFYILNGNHSEAYAKLINEGFDKCMEYFKKNIHQINKYSDKLSCSV